MATVKESLKGFVAGSIHERPFDGQTAQAAPGPRPSVQRQTEGRKRLEGASEIRLDRIVRDPTQPREEFDEVELQQLADNIRQRGVLTPIRVRWSDEDDRYIIVLGERRFRASVLAQRETIPCVVVADQATPEEILEDQLYENAYRMDLKPIEKAKAYKRLLDARGLSQRELADRLRISPATLSQSLAMLGLEPEIQESVDEGRIAPNAAWQLTKVEDPAERAALAKEAEAGRLKRDDLQKATRATRKASSKDKGASKAKPPKPRTFARLRSGKVTVEPKAPGPEGVLAALDEAAAIVKAEAEAAGQGREQAA
jgi:ParB family chromosome partitioning protein